MPRSSLLLLILAAFTLNAAAGQQPAKSHDSAAPAPVRKRIFVDGKPIPASQTTSKDGVTYADAALLAEALGAKVQNSEGSLIIRTEEKPTSSCDKAGAVEGEHFTEQFRSDVAGVADEIESLRAAVLKKEKVPLGPRFDAIDRKLTASTAHVQTDADSAVYYALSYANNSLAISYYKELRGAPLDEAQKNQLDSMMCSMESKFALMKGVLVPGGSCSVFKRLETQAHPAPAEQPE